LYTGFRPEDRCHAPAPELPLDTEPAGHRTPEQLELFILQRRLL
jgi:hypothetical protein